MPIFIDRYRIKYRRYRMSHMVAIPMDDEGETELHRVANAMGIHCKWFQSGGTWPHYDFCESKRQIAIDEGAIEVSTREMVKMIAAEKEKLRDSRLRSTGTTTSGAA